MKSTSVTENLVYLITHEGTAKGMRLSLLGAKMNSKSGVGAISLSETSTWREYPEANPLLFSCDPKGQTRVCA